MKRFLIVALVISFLASLSVAVALTTWGSPGIVKGSDGVMRDSRVLPGVWHRLNPDQTNATPEHEAMACGGLQKWYCRYDKHPEPRQGFEQPPHGTHGLFQGGDTTEAWNCPPWFPPDICENATLVVSGTMSFSIPESSPLLVDEELIVTKGDGTPVLYVYWVDQFVCPWYKTFDQALAANPFPTPFNGTDWPAMDCVFAP